MTGELNVLFVATLAFVGGHFLLSSRAPRRALLRSLGPNGFVPAYALAVTAAFLWMITAYREAPYVELWPLVPVLAWVPAVVMPVALLLAVAGLTTRNPTMVGAEQRLADARPEAPAPGIITVTRHPFLWGTALWAASHMVVNGDLASAQPGRHGAHRPTPRGLPRRRLGAGKADHQRHPLRRDREPADQARLARHRLVAPGARGRALPRARARPRLADRRAGVSDGGLAQS
jgi:hypothetical protein